MQAGHHKPVKGNYPKPEKQTIHRPIVLFFGMPVFTWQCLAYRSIQRKQLLAVHHIAPRQTTLAQHFFM